MTDMKRCQQCGLLKDAESYRPYTYARQNNTQGRYRICRQCEAINSRYKRAIEMSKGPASQETAEAQEIIRKTEQLYSQLTARGLRVPGTQQPGPQDQTAKAVDMLLDFYRDDTPPTATVEYPKEALPQDLCVWLEASQEEWLANDLSPEYLQETVYESLKAKYRPQTGIDKERLLPIYDDTYKAVLNEILKRFDDYEEFISSQEKE